MFKRLSSIRYMLDLAQRFSPRKIDTPPSAVPPAAPPVGVAKLAVPANVQPAQPAKSLAPKGAPAKAPAVKTPPAKTPAFKAHPVKNQSVKAQPAKASLQNSHPTTGQSLKVPQPAQPVRVKPALQAVEEEEIRPVGRPVSRSLTFAVEQLAMHPEITAAELADRLNVSRDYARTLIKRGRLKLNARTPKLTRVAAPVTVPVVAPVTTSRLTSVSAPSAAPAIKDTIAKDLDELRRVLEDTRAQVRELAAAPPPVRRNLHLNKRAAILNLRQKGNQIEDIAEQLDLNVGEVEFVLKVDRLNSQTI